MRGLTKNVLRVAVTSVEEEEEEDEDDDDEAEAWTWNAVLIGLES